MSDGQPRRTPRAFWWIVGTAGGVLGLFVLCWGLVGWRYASGVPTVSFDVLAELRLVSGVPLPEGEGAWPAVKEVVEGVPEGALSGFGFYRERLAAERSAEAVVEAAEARAWIAANPERVERLLTAVERGPLGWRPAADEGVEETPAEAVWTSRLFALVEGAAHLLGAEAAVAVESGDGPRAERAVLGILRTAATYEEIPSAWATLFRRSVEADAAAVLSLGLDAGVWDAAALDRLSAAAGGWDPTASAVAALRGEELLVQDVIQRSYTDDGSGGGRVTPAGAVPLGLPQPVDAAERHFGTRLGWPDRGSLLERMLIGPVLLLQVPGRAEVAERVTQKFDLKHQAMKSPSADARRAVLVTREESVAAGCWPGSADLSLTHAGGLAVFLHLSLQAQAQRDARVAALAAFRFRAEHGRFPGTPAEAGVADRGPAGRLFFAVRGEGLIVYAAGADGDDDGGREPADGVSAFPPFDPDAPGPPPDGDVVLFGG